VVLPISTSDGSDLGVSSKITRKESLNIMENMLNNQHLLASIVYSFIGIVILVSGFWIIDRLTPFKLWEEICEEHNVALAILLGCTALSISHIIASAIHG
jgi:putative membrane protein